MSQPWTRANQVARSSLPSARKLDMDADTLSEKMSGNYSEFFFFYQYAERHAEGIQSHNVSAFVALSQATRAAISGA